MQTLKNIFANTQKQLIDPKFSNFMKITNPHMHEAQQTPRTRNTKKNSSWHTIITLLKSSEKKKILKAAKRKKRHVTE